MKTQTVGGITVTAKQVNDSLGTGWRGEYELGDSNGAFTANRTADSYSTAYEAEDAALTAGVARAEEYAAAEKKDWSEMCDKDEADMMERGWMRPF